MHLTFIFFLLTFRYHEKLCSKAVLQLSPEGPLLPLQQIQLHAAQPSASTVDPHHVPLPAGVCRAMVGHISDVVLGTMF